MNGEDFIRLCEQAPRKHKPVTLDDGRTVTLYELPIGVMSDIQRVAADDQPSMDMTDTIASVAAHALLGRTPTDQEQQTLADSFGASQVMCIYYEALRLSSLAAGAIEHEKKD